MKRLGERTLRGAAAIGAVLVFAALADSSFAAPRICSQLKAELAAARSGGGSGQSRKYDRAIAAQKGQLSTARSRARQAGCGLGFLSPQMCRPLNAQIDRMEINLAALERKRQRLAGSARPTRSRAAILASLDANGCRHRAVAERKPEREEDTSDLFARLFGRGIREGETLEQSDGPANVARILNPNGEVTVLGPPGQFSTMCVRTCDGYYFPMSPNSSSVDFDRDQRNCESTCPGTEVQLYYRPAGGEESETMMSAASGEPYASLATAYLYRDTGKPRPLACGCAGAAANPNFSVIAGETAEEDVPAAPVIPRPSARPDPALDPETLANAEGRLDIETVKRILKPKPVAAPILPPGERKVRVVGPVFLPDPEGAIDLKALVPKQVQ
jgi:hypothetical protein